MPLRRAAFGSASLPVPARIVVRTVATVTCRVHARAFVLRRGGGTQRLPRRTPAALRVTTATIFAGSDSANVSCPLRTLGLLVKTGAVASRTAAGVTAGLEGTVTVPVTVVRLPISSVARRVAVCVPGAANACATEEPVAMPPSLNSHDSGATGDQMSVTDPTVNWRCSPGAPWPGMLTPRTIGPAPSKAAYWAW